MKKKKSTPKDTPTPEYDSERETRVLLEKIGTDVEKIAEQVASNSTKLKKLDTIEEDVAVLKSDMSIVKTGVRRNSDKIDKIDKKLDTVTEDHEHRIQKLEAVR